MKAMVITRFGGPEVFQQQELPTPTPGDDEVLVRVHATSINPVDYKLREDGSAMGITLPAILGGDVSGVIEAVGKEVQDFKAGDEVFYTTELNGKGSYAEFHVAKAAIVVPKPTNLSHTDAASIPLAGCTAWDMLITRAQVRVGESVLIHGGAGGVGSLAIQIAKAAGAFVITTCSKDDMDLVRKLGADEAIDYHSDDVIAAVKKANGGAGVDIVLDTVGGETLAKSLPAIKPHGRMSSILGSTGDLSAAGHANVTIHFIMMERDKTKMEGLRTLIERGQLRPVVGEVMALDDVAQAQQKVEDGDVTGKLVLRVA